MSSEEESGRRMPRPLKVTIAVLATFGVLAAIGSYVTTQLIEWGVGRVTSDVAVEVVPVLDQDPNFVFPDSVAPDSVPAQILSSQAVVDMGEFSRWAVEQGGVVTNQQRVRLIVRGTSDRQVTFTVGLKVVERGAPLAGWYNAWTGCGAVLEPNELRADLSGDPPSMEWRIGGEQADSNTPFVVSANEQEAFDIIVTVAEEQVSWRVVLDFEAGSDEDRHVVDETFTVTSAAESRAYVYSDEQGELVRVPDQDHATGPIC